jgi:integrase
LVLANQSSGYPKFAVTLRRAGLKSGRPRRFTCTYRMLVPIPANSVAACESRGTLVPVALDQRRKGRKSMSRRSAQKGCIVPKGRMWHVRFYVDVPGKEKRERRSEPVGPRKGMDKLTKSEAERKGAELIHSLGVNTEEHLQRAINPVQTFRKKTNWCRQYHKAWVDGRPGPVKTMESQLTKHILPRFGDLPLDLIDEMRVQEFVADLKRTTFQMKKPNGDPIKTYKLSPKTILNIVGVVKLILGRKVWHSWEETNFGLKRRPRQRNYRKEQMQQIINLAEGQYKVLFTLLAGTGLRIGEAAGLWVEDMDLDNCVIHVRRSFCETASSYLDPKTEAGKREVDIHAELAQVLRHYLCGRCSGLVFQSQNGSPLRGGNIIKRVLNPILDQLGIPRGGKVLHAFRHGRVTLLRVRQIPGDLQKQWIGHTSLQTTDGYSHTNEELEYRREFANKVGLNGPNGPN